MMQTTGPEEHQKLGRQAKGFNRAVWDESTSMTSGSGESQLIRSPDKSRIVEEGNYHKFTKSENNAKLLKMLLNTGSRELVEVGRDVSPAWLRCI